MQINILEYLDKAAEVFAAKTAYSDGTDELTFAEVNKRARSIGSHIAGQGYNRQPVAVFMRRHPETITAFYGVISAGCYYIPLDEEMPAHRIEMILNNVKPVLIIHDKTTREQAQKLAQGCVLIEYDNIIKTNVNNELLASVRMKAIDTDPVYIVFTSGSTGIPKGVVACHRTVIDYIEQLSEILSVDENTIFGNQTPLYLDACLKELIPVLMFGGKSFIIPKQLFMFPLKLVEYLNVHQINTVCWVVTALTMISGLNVLDKSVPEHLKTIAFASEVFPLKQFRRWRSALPDARFINLYGPTEATGVCCFYEVDRDFADDEPIPIGRAFGNREILLLTEDNRLADPGATGEICVRGSTLTHGYYRDFERTRESFVQNPLNDLYPEIIYRTGDLGRVNDRGELIFVSRKDYQIKHMGHRIELGEIESVAASVPGIGHTGCIYDKDKKRIILYYTGDTDENSLRNILLEKLPRYMVPARIKKIEQMPLTGNSKIDRTALINTCQIGG
jgi:amino acid adenylation domain-containing protein